MYMQAFPVTSFLMSGILHQVQFNLKMSLFCPPDFALHRL